MGRTSGRLGNNGFKKTRSTDRRCGDIKKFTDVYTVIGALGNERKRKKKKKIETLERRIWPAVELIIFIDI